MRLQPSLLTVRMCFQDHNMQKVLELAGHATAEAGFADWWWKERLGKAYYQLGLLRDAEKQLASAAKHQVGAARVMHRCASPAGPAQGACW